MKIRRDCTTFLISPYFSLLNSPWSYIVEEYACRCVHELSMRLQERWKVDRFKGGRELEENRGVEKAIKLSLKVQLKPKCII